MKILVLNSGSSSQKSCLYEIVGSIPENPSECLWKGTIEWDGEGDGGAEEIKSSRGTVLKQRTKAPSRRQAIEDLLGTLWKGGASVIASPSEIEMVGHRIVHGGPHYREPVILIPEVRAAIVCRRHSLHCRTGSNSRAWKLPSKCWSSSPVRCL